MATGFENILFWFFPFAKALKIIEFMKHQLSAYGILINLKIQNTY